MGLLTPLAIKIGGQPWLPRFNPQIVAIDKALHRVTGGRVSILDIAGLPNLMLTVAGRKSGVERSVPLLCVPVAADILIAGSFWGGPNEPAWVKNVEAVEATGGTVRVGRDGREAPYSVRRLAGQEREEAWRTMVATWPNYAKYQTRTDRVIKLFRLTPAPGTSDA